MPRGEHPNSRKALDQNRHKGAFNAETAVKAKEKSDQAKAVYRSLNGDLREQCTPEVIAEINKRLVQMAKHGNLKAYELLRGGLGETPSQNMNVNVDSNGKLDEIFTQLGGNGLEE